MRPLSGRPPAMTNDAAAWERWRDNTLAAAREALEAGRGAEARALAAMVRDSIPRGAVR